MIQIPQSVFTPFHLSLQSLERHSIAQLQIGNHLNLNYLLIDHTEKTFIIIDPFNGILRECNTLLNSHYHLKACLLTHTHPDHTCGLKEILELNPELPIYYHPHEEDRLLLRVEPACPVYLKDKDLIPFGSLFIQVFHSPGHSSGELCYFLQTNSQPFLFSGDTLFVRDCGNTHQDTGSDQALFETLQKIKKLPPNTIILPGHHYSPEYWTTLETELKTSPPLLCQTLEEFKKLS
jgi:glyoxylase-like metal-dependent hydrolase (beta-lactamase superfamily II)